MSKYFIYIRDFRFLFLRIFLGALTLTIVVTSTTNTGSNITHIVTVSDAITRTCC